MATFYISTSGQDLLGRSGLVGQEWASLGYACTRVTTPGDIIHVNAGSYIQNTQVILATDVSIEGVGDASLIYLRFQHTDGGQFCMRVANGTNTIGQSISYVKFSGDNLTGYQAILVYARSNVSIHHCTFENFLQQGVSFSGGGSWGSNTWKTGNSFYNNTVTNCAGGPSGLFGDEGYALTINDQQGFRCYNNTIVQPSRGANLVGVCVGGMAGTRDCKIYNNTITNIMRLAVNWNFAVEFHAPAGMEVYNNIITGEWDTGTVYTGGYSYGLWFHDNTCGWSSPQSGASIGLQIEGSLSGAIINNNTFKNLEVPLYFCQFADFSPPDDVVENLSIYCNLIYNVGRTDMNYGWGIRFESGSNDPSEDPPAYYNNIDIWNNTIVAYVTRPALYGIELPTHARNTSTMYIDLRNNIIVGFSTAGIVAKQQDTQYTTAIDQLLIAKNILYSNGNSNNLLNSGTTLTNYSNDGGIKSDPLFVSSPTNLHLSSTSSPAYHTGAYVGLISDYDDVNYANPPSIGAYEIATAATLPTLTTTAVTSIGTSTATSGGNVTSDGGASVTARGVCWSTSSNPIASGSHTTNGTGIGSFVSYVTGLSASTTYYIRAYATNSVGTAYGNQYSFVTDSVLVLPTVTTGLVTSVVNHIAYGGGTVVSDGGATVTVRGVCWGTSHSPTIANSITTDGSGIGSYSSTMTGILDSVTYYVRAYATNSVGTAYGQEESFIEVADSIVDIKMSNLCKFSVLGYIAEIYIEYTDGIDLYRKGVRNGVFIVDKALTPTGFSGIENYDWENVREI